ncbi:MAG TPA: ribulose-phosphate 3-epimerase [Fimbriimonas sp.]
MPLKLELGVKSDPIEYRYSFPWLFDLMASEGVENLQLGTFFEIYQLPDDYFRDLREQADRRGVRIRSVFTSHRELGGFFREEPAFVEVARRNYERLIEIGALVGADSVGCNPGAVPRDRMETKREGVRTYLRHMKELMREAHSKGVGCLTMEPMSCLAEPPTLPDEICEFASELDAHHTAHPSETSRIGYCADVSHGYADERGRVVFDNMALLEAGLPWTRELHLRNTDAMYASTIGFTEADLDPGVVDVPAVRRYLLENASRLPVRELVGYLEIPGPKLGRDYSDPDLEASLRGSLQTLRRQWLGGAEEQRPGKVRLMPSIMCADMGHLAAEVGRLEAIGADMIHVDVMDAHFVPNMPLGLGLVEALRKLTKLPLDVHLMVENNDLFIEKLAEIGVERISIHAETAVHLNRTIRSIRGKGIQAGIALCPATPLNVLDYAQAFDFLLLMTVDPGFAGQPLVEGAIGKISEARARLQGRNISIEVDGCVSFANIPKMVESGADELVLGSSSLFHPGAPYRENMRRIRQVLEG